MSLNINFNNPNILQNPENLIWLSRNFESACIQILMISKYDELAKKCIQNYISVVINRLLL